MNECAVWAANAAVVWMRQDDEREAEVQCTLRKLRAEAARNVPGWQSWMRLELSIKQRQAVKFHRN